MNQGRCDADAECRDMVAYRLTQDLGSDRPIEVASLCRYHLLGTLAFRMSVPSGFVKVTVEPLEESP